MLKRTYQFGLILALAFGMASCGGDKPAETKDSSNEPATPAVNEEPAVTEEAPEAKHELVADIEANLEALGESMAEMAYSDITVEAFVNLKLNFTNTSSTAGMIHNAVIIPKDDAIADEIRTAGMKAGAPDYEPTDDRIIAKTKMLQPGESTSVVFETPGPGEYYIICTYPGHQNMVGTLLVE